jgi:hypothetical protein
MNSAGPPNFSMAFGQRASASIPMIFAGAQIDFRLVVGGRLCSAPELDSIPSG